MTVISNGGSHQSSNLAANQKFTGVVLWAALLSALGCLLFGYDTGITSGSMVFIKGQFKLSSLWEEAIVSMTLWSAALFSAVSGPVSNRCGRKFVILTASFVFTIGSFIMAFSNEKIQLLIGRSIIGVGIGFVATNGPNYIAEVAPIRFRGTLLAMSFVFIVSGQLIAGIIAGALTYLPEDVSWRYMLGVAAAPSALQFMGFLFMPESPRWLVQTGRNEEAVKVLKKIRGTDQVMAEFLKIKEEVEASRSEGGFLDAWRSPVCRRILIFVSILWATHEFSGINTLMYYTATMVQMAGIYDKSQAVWYAAGISAFYVLFSCSGMYLVEKIGRRKLLLCSITGVVISLLLIGTGFVITEMTGPVANTSDASQGVCGQEQYSSCVQCTQLEKCGFCYSPDNQFASLCVAVGKSAESQSRDGWCANGTMTTGGVEAIYLKDYCPSPYSFVVLIGMISFLIFFGPGLGAMALTLTAEVFPLEFRSVGTSYGLCLNWIMNATVSLTFLTLTEVLGEASTYWLYAAITIAGGVTLFFIVPETKGKSLEDNNALFQGS